MMVNKQDLEFYHIQKLALESIIFYILYFIINPVIIILFY